MCGIICYFGQNQGAIHILEALHLLEYRAPDSSGLAVINEIGSYSIRRSTGAAQMLVQKMAVKPLYPVMDNDLTIDKFFFRQGLHLTEERLRDLSCLSGYAAGDLYDSPELRIGIGDRGSRNFEICGTHQIKFFPKLEQTLEEIQALPSPDYDQDPVRHAFRLVGAHVASRADLDPRLMAGLTKALQNRVPEGSYQDWRQAWIEEVSFNTPGQAFAVAVRHFQQTFPGLSDHLENGDWERVGGITADAMSQVVVGHGRWAMVGAATEENAHPFLDRSQTRIVCENGSHNASLLLELSAEQKRWWYDRGLPASEPVHRSDNTTEVIVYEWERTVFQIRENDLDRESLAYIEQLRKQKVDDIEEQALRLTLWRLRSGNAHACAFQSRINPGVLYVSSHNKPIAIIHKETISPNNRAPRHEIMVASDMNAALVLWPVDQVNEAVKRLNALKKLSPKDETNRKYTGQEIQSILDEFSADVFFLDQGLNGGKELFARVQNQLVNGKISPVVEVSSYDGTPVNVPPKRIQINPSMAVQHGHPSYTEFHIAEIPEVLDRLADKYTQDGKIRLESLWFEGKIFSPGINLSQLTERFGKKLENLQRLVLIGEGSSWRNAQAAAPLFQTLLPKVRIACFRPVELLNLGKAIDPTRDLVVLISWSGTTDSVLKSDSRLAEEGALRLGITGRPQSDLGRRTVYSAGTLNVHSGVEVSVATVKGFEAILMTLNLLAFYLAEISQNLSPSSGFTTLIDELANRIPKHIRAIIEDKKRRERIQKAARRCRRYNKVAIIGNSPVVIEAELKIEELAQIVAGSFGFHTSSLQGMMERSAIVEDDHQRTLFIINATSKKTQREAQPLINYLNMLGTFFIVHTIPGEKSEPWRSIPNALIFDSPHVSELLQPLIDILFFFDFAVALAYGRGLSPREIDRPRNLAKSVTTTGAEKRSEVESRSDFINITMEEYSRDRTDLKPRKPLSETTVSVDDQASTAIKSALSVLTEPIPKNMVISPGEDLVLVSEVEAVHNAVQMARGTWVDLLKTEISINPRYPDGLPGLVDETRILRLERVGATLAFRDFNTIVMPLDYSPLQLELAGMVFLIGLAVRLARRLGKETEAWENGLANLPQTVKVMLEDLELTKDIGAILEPFVRAGYDKAQVIGGGQDFASAESIARSLRSRGFMAEALYSDSAWHGPLATVGGPDAEHDTLVIILATDPLFQPAAMVDTQVYRARNAPVILIVPENNKDLRTVQGVRASAVFPVPALPRPFLPVANTILGAALAREMDRLWSEQIDK